MLPKKFPEFLRAEMPRQIAKVHDMMPWTGRQQAAFLYHLHALIIIKRSTPMRCGHDQQNSRLPTRYAKFALKVCDPLGYFSHRFEPPASHNNFLPGWRFRPPLTHLT